METEMRDFAREMTRIGNDMVKAHGGDGRPMAKALPAAMEPEPDTMMSGKEFLAQAELARKAGRLTPTQLAEIEQTINLGQKPGARFIKAVMTDTNYDDA